jgi:hypothetical protein
VVAWDRVLGLGLVWAGFGSRGSTDEGAAELLSGPDHAADTAQSILLIVQECRGHRGMSCDITMLELRHLYSNLLPGPETLAELRDRASTRLRPANHASVRQVQHRLGPARIEELIAAYRRGATAAALAVQFQIHRTTVAALLQRQENRLKELGMSERAFSLPFAHQA